MNASPTTPSRQRWGAAAVAGLIASTYLLIGTDRDPSFEPWGLTIKASQLLLLGLLTYALVRPASPITSRTDPPTDPPAARPHSTPTREHSGRS